MVFSRTHLDSDGNSRKESCSVSSADADGPNHQLDLDEEYEGLGGVMVHVNIPDGRLCAEEIHRRSRTVLRVDPLDRTRPASTKAIAAGVGRLDPAFSIKLSTSHYAFSLKRSSTIRTLSSFYVLGGILKHQNPDASLPGLPSRPLIFLHSSTSQAEQLATWLTAVLTSRLQLSNRALHLFLQTQISMDRILENSEGVLDDQVVDSRWERPTSKDGFHTLFGRSFRGSKRMLQDQS